MTTFSKKEDESTLQPIELLFLTLRSLKEEKLSCNAYTLIPSIIHDCMAVNIGKKQSLMLLGLLMHRAG